MKKYGLGSSTEEQGSIGLERIKKVRSWLGDVTHLTAKLSSDVRPLQEVPERMSIAIFDWLNFTAVDKKQKRKVFIKKE